MTSLPEIHCCNSFKNCLNHHTSITITCLLFSSDFVYAYILICCTHKPRHSLCDLLAIWNCARAIYFSQALFQFLMLAPLYWPYMYVRPLILCFTIKSTLHLCWMHKIVAIQPMTTSVCVRSYTYVLFCFQSDLKLPWTRKLDCILLL